MHRKKLPRKDPEKIQKFTINIQEKYHTDYTNIHKQKHTNANPKTKKKFLFIKFLFSGNWSLIKVRFLFFHETICEIFEAILSVLGKSDKEFFEDFQKLCSFLILHEHTGPNRFYTKLQMGYH